MFVLWIPITKDCWIICEYKLLHFSTLLINSTIFMKFGGLTCPYLIDIVEKLNTLNLIISGAKVNIIITTGKLKALEHADFERLLHSCLNNYINFLFLCWFFDSFARSFKFRWYLSIKFMQMFKNREISKTFSTFTTKQELNMLLRETAAT